MVKHSYNGAAQCLLTKRPHPAVWRRCVQPKNKLADLNARRSLLFTKPEVYPLRIPGWEIVLSSCSIYADVIKPPSELGAAEERQMQRENIHHKTPTNSF